MMGTSIKDVARIAGVSPATVSRVFNNKKNISAETKKMILTVAEELGYQPRAYKKKPSLLRNNVGIVFSKRLDSLVLDPFYGQVMAGLEEILKKFDYKLFFKTISGKVSEDNSIIRDLIRDESLAGLILTGYDIDRETIIYIKKEGVPLVLVDNNLWDEDIDCVVNDNIAGARKMVSYLIELGHRQIVFLGGPTSHSSLEERFIGYRQALNGAGIKEKGNLILQCSPTFNIKDGYIRTFEAFRNFRNRPTAIFAANDMLALGAIKAINELNMNVPEDISIAGFDDIQMAEHTTPSLTTVKIYKNEMGALAGKRLYELIKGENTKAIKQLVSVDIIIRGTTARIN